MLNRAYLLAPLVLACSFWSTLNAQDAKKPEAKPAAKKPTLVQLAAPEGEEAKEPETVEEYVEAINKKLSPPQDIPGAIATGEAAIKKFPEDEKLLIAVSILMHDSLQVEPNQKAASSRRYRLGEIARTLIERHQDDLKALGNLPMAFLIEEARAHVSEKKIDDAWKSIEQAHELGFDQSKILFFDPSLQPLLENEKIAAKVKAWLQEDVERDVAASKPFRMDFKLTSFAGGEVSKKDLEGKIAIIDFWGTWCPPCRETIPHLVKLQKDYAQDVSILGVTISDPALSEIPFDEFKAQFDQFVKQTPLNYPCVIGDRETVDMVPGLEGYPTIVVLDKEGNSVLTMKGYQPYEYLEAVVKHFTQGTPNKGIPAKKEKVGS